MGGGSLLDKLTAKQLDKLLEQTGEEGRRQHELDVQRNRMTFVLLLSLPILTVLLCFLFLHYDKGDRLREIIALLIGLAGGGAGGFTLAKATSRNSDS